MYSWEKPSTEDKPRKNPRKPSFSSTLLDEIMNSIDGNDEKCEDFKVYKEMPTKQHGGGWPKTSRKEDEEIGILWREKEINEKIIARRRAELEKLWLQENDSELFFSSNSNSSDSSGALSSSDSELFWGSNSIKSRISCFSAPKLKPVRTSGRGENHLFHDQNKVFMYQNKQENKVDDNLIKSKSRALKIYANLNKMKQPISPGARLTNFINSLFANSKKTKKSNPNGGFEDSNMERKSKSQQGSSTCSSASSFSRSCLIKNPSKSVENIGIGNRRTVRFHPVNVIVDEDSNSLPSDHKSVKKNEGSDKFGRPPLPPDLRFSPGEKNRRIQDSTRDYSKVYPNQRKDDFALFKNIRHKIEDYEDEDNDDAASDSSSELFELDHLALFGNKKKFSQELPVYETTHFDTNHAIASGLIQKL